MMSQLEQYKVTVQMRPEGRRTYQDADFAKQTQAALRGFTERFKPDAQSIEAIPPGDPWVGAIVAVFASKEPALRVGKWMDEKFLAVLPNRGWILAAPAGPASIAQARWVRLEGQVPHIREFANVPVRCGKCGWLDFDAIPKPVVIDASVANGRADIVLAMRGLMIVTKPVLSSLQDLAKNDFDAGEVEIKGKPKEPGPWFWVRPRATLGNYPSQGKIGDTCPSCRLPERFTNGMMGPTTTGGQVVQSYADAKANLALIGEFPQMADRSPSNKMVCRDFAISGGLYAAFLNLGFKGLTWPKSGPLVSLNPKEPTWETSRRFADRFGPKEDKILKRKEPDWSI